jgi:hypothetical protein
MDENEPLMEGLDALPQDAFQLPEPPEDLRRSVFERTGRVVKARARRRRLLHLAVVAAAYIGGITTALLLTESVVRTEEVAQVSLEKAPVAEPGDLVRRSETAPARERIHLLTRAGDLYLSDLYDVENALACYRSALNAMPDAERTRVATEDTWLLAALKDSRR